MTGKGMYISGRPVLIPVCPLLIPVIFGNIAKLTGILN